MQKKGTYLLEWHHIYSLLHRIHVECTAYLLRARLLLYYRVGAARWWWNKGNMEVYHRSDQAARVVSEEGKNLCRVAAAAFDRTDRHSDTHTHKSPIQTYVKKATTINQSSHYKDLFFLMFF